MNNQRSRNKGFSLIEVMVTLVLLTIGMLGLVAMQGRSIQYTQDSAQRNNAAMLATELMEMIRANPDDSGEYLLTELPAQDDDISCDGSAPTENSDVEKQLGCWANTVRLLLPDADTLKDEFHVCRSKTPGTCAAGSAIEIQLAWRAVGEGCLDANAAENADTSICRLSIRGEL